MYKSLLLLLTFLSVSNSTKFWESSVNQRITNGQDAPEGKFPFLVSILQKEEHACGGSIISEILVLTAAHCCYDLTTDVAFEPEDLKVSVGSLFWRKGIFHDVRERIIHENFAVGAVGSDVAILVLTEPIEFTANVQPVKINPVPVSTKNPLKCVTAGWGYRMIKGRVDSSTDHQLQYVEVMTIPLKECQERIVDVEFDVDSSYICVFAGDGKGTCNADSGAPLMYNDKQIGILSLGLDCNNILPEFYTRISDFYTWIRAIERETRE